MQLDIERFIEGIQDYISRALKPLAERIIALESLKAERGEKGESGPQGEKGEPGTVDLEAIYAQFFERYTQKYRGNLLEEILRTIGKPENGKDGRDGRDGKDGKDGRDGANGKDALEIQILRSIPEHPVLGMWAADNGGLWRYSTLGWEIMVDGLASFDVRIHEDMRTFSVDLLSASGERVIKEFRIPVMLFRDIFKDGSEYFMGDVVVADNSSWHCQVESTKSRPGVSPDWRLMARKGTPGKDGKDGERGPEGKPGRDGK